MKLNIVENYGELSRLAALQLLAVLAQGCEKRVNVRSEEHTSELQSQR